MKYTPFSVIIPARFYSSRLPGKPLLEIAGKPMIQHVYEQASKSQAKQIIIATDDERIVQVAEKFGAKTCLTLSHHPSGTDRIQEVTATMGLDQDDIIVNVQGDEPLLPAVLINQVANNLIQYPLASTATLCEKIYDIEQVFNPNIVKVTMDNKGYALYFSRAPIPWSREHFSLSPPTMPNTISYFKHIGIYAYRVLALNQFVSWKPSESEKTESLEQLRLLSFGQKIHVAKTLEPIPHSIDTEKDLYEVRHIMQKEIRTV